MLNGRFFRISKNLMDQFSVDQFSSRTFFSVEVIS